MRQGVQPPVELHGIEHMSGPCCLNALAYEKDAFVPVTSLRGGD